MDPNLLLVSSSRCHPHNYLDHCESAILDLFKGTTNLIFVPFARPGGSSYEEYTEIAQRRFTLLNKNMRGIHEFSDFKQAIEDCEGIFVGGGNTFLLLRELYRHDLIEAIKQKVQAGVPYMGTSAGSNIAGLTIGTSNDMPIVFPPSFDALGIVPFNLNPHFPKTPQDPTHNGETREDRIREFHFQNNQPVVALYEDGMLRIHDRKMTLIGESDALVFRPQQSIEHLNPGKVLSVSL